MNTTNFMGENDISRDISVWFFGASFLWALLLLFIFGDSPFPQSVRQDPGMVLVGRILFCAALALVSLLSFFARTTVKLLVERKSFLTAIACVCAMGVLLSVLDSSKVFGVSLNYAGSFCAGCASGLLLIAWGEYGKLLNTKTAHICVYVTEIFAAVLFFIVSVTSVELAQEFHFILVAFPLLSLLFLISARSEPFGAANNRGESDFNFRSFVLSFIGLSITCVAFGIMLGLMSVRIHIESTVQIATIQAVAVALFSGAMLILAKYFLKPVRPERVFQLAFFFAAAGFFVGSLPIVDIPAIAGMSTIAGCTALLTFVIFFCITLSNKFPSTSFSVVCVSIFSCSLGATIGYIFVFAINWNFFLNDLVPFIETFAVFILILGNILLTRRSEALSIWQLTATSSPENEILSPINLSSKRVAEQYGLTAREEEILVFLAIGRDGVFIQETLSLSIYTVRTHIRNIYRKLNIHNRQDLLDLIHTDDDALKGSSTYLPRD